MHYCLVVMDRVYPIVSKITQKCLSIFLIVHKYWKSPKLPENPKIPKSAKIHPKSTLKYSKVPKRTQIWPNVPNGTPKSKMYLEVPKTAQNYPKVLKSTQKYIKVPKCKMNPIYYYLHSYTYSHFTIIVFTEPEESNYDHELMGWTGEYFLILHM